MGIPAQKNDDGPPRRARRAVVGTQESDLVHAAHATTAGATSRRRLVFLLLHDQRFGREQQARDGRGVLERGARDLGRVDDAGLDQVLVGLGQRVVAERVFLRAADLLDHQRRLAAGVLDDHADRLLERALDDLDAHLLIGFLELEALERPLSAEQRDTTTGDDALFDGGTRGVQRVFDAGLLLLHLGFGRGADVDHGDTTGELRETLLELLLVVVRGARVDRDLDLLDAALDLRLLTVTVDDGRVVLVDDDALGAAEVRDDGVLELEADFLA